jgi:hypothetical protein
VIFNFISIIETVPTFIIEIPYRTTRVVGRSHVNSDPRVSNPDNRAD